MSCEEAVKDPASLAESTVQTEWPSEINLNKKSRTLELVWSGTHATISHKVLRRSCRCSVCESTRRKLNDVIPVASDIELLKIEMLGSIGVQLFFSDKHNRGIYPWAYLRQIAFGPIETGFTESLMKGWCDE
jgi:DUF971 family protein